MLHPVVAERRAATPSLNFERVDAEVGEVRARGVRLWRRTVFCTKICRPQYCSRQTTFPVPATVLQPASHILRAGHNIAAGTVCFVLLPAAFCVRQIIIQYVGQILQTANYLLI